MIYDIEDPEVNSDSQHKWMNLAKKLTKKSEFPDVKMAAVAIKGGRIVSMGVNKVRKGFAKSKLYRQAQAHHSELDLVLSVDKELLLGSTIYVAGINASGTPCWCSKPCPQCQQLLRLYGIRAAIYHDRQGNLYRYKL